MKSIIFFLCVLFNSQFFSEEIDLSLDIEIKEPKNIIFNRIIDIATDSKNNIYLLDSKEKMVYLFNDEGIFLKKIGRPGQGPGELSKPTSIYIDSKDIIYIFDKGNIRVEIFDSEADYIRSIKSNDFPSAGRTQIIVDRKGEFYISGYYKGKDTVLCKFSSIGKLIKSFPLPVIEYKGRDFDDFQKTMIMFSLNGGSMCFDEKERIFFSYFWPYSIKLLTKEGNELFQFSRENNLNWKPMIFRGKEKGYVLGESTRTYGIFFLNDKYMINSILNVDWEGNPEKKIPLPLTPSIIEKYMKIKGVSAVLDFYTSEGEFIASVKMDEKIYFLTSDKKGRIIGIKLDEEDIPTIVRYCIALYKNKPGKVR